MALKRKTAAVDKDYPITVRRLASAEGGGWLASVPDLPGCHGDGATPEAALRDARAAIAAWIATAQEFGDRIPAPRRDDAFSGQWRVRVPRSLHRKLAERAAQEGVSLNTFTATLLAEGIGERRARANQSALAKIGRRQQ